MTDTGEQGGAQLVDARQPGNLRRLLPQLLSLQRRHCRTSKGAQHPPVIAAEHASGDVQGPGHGDRQVQRGLGRRGVAG